MTFLLSAALLLSAPQQGDKKGEVQPPPRFQAPPAPVVPPARALDTFKVAPGFRLELVAAEPLVADPVALAWDGDARLWVVEMLGLMPNVDGKGEDAPVGRIVVLEDVDGDGRMDRSTVFLDKLVLPRAIAISGDGVLVAEPPALWFCRDVTGDLKCDEKQIVTSTYGGRGNPEHTANGLLRGIDNWIYSANTGLRLRRMADGKWLRGETRSRGQWGLAQDDEGRLYYNSNSDFLRGDRVPVFSPEAHSGKSANVGVSMTPDQSTWPARMNPGINRGYQKGTLRDDGTLARCTAACGPVIYRGDAYPAEFAGNAFLCEPAGNLVARRVFVDGIGRNPYDKAEFLASTDERFRPVNLYSGPDGCLTIVDLYRGILQHRNFVTTYLRQQILERGLEAPTGLGRIYRLVHESRAPRKPARLSKAPAAELVALLSHADGWTRDTAQRLLVERRDPRAADAVRALARDAKAAAVPRLHAVFVLEGVDQLDAPTVAALEADADPRIRLAVSSAKEGADPLGRIVVAAAERPVFDPKAAGREIDVLERMSVHEGWEEETPGRASLIRELAGRAIAAGKADRIDDLLDLAGAQINAARWRQRAILEGMSAAKPAKDVALRTRSAALMKLSFSDDATVRATARGVLSWVSWPKKAVEPEPPPVAPLTAEQEDRARRGRRQYLASCAVCHHPTGLGEDGKGPPLVDSDWTLGSEERLVRIVLHGLHGPVTVGGRVYASGEMPAVLSMSSDEISEVLTYLRREWGHRAAPVDPAAVRRIRAATEDREDPWTEKELLRIP